jgi:flavin reductase (DIM6/NTAB) family NADH-FMN oxidoreductase RutF
MLSISDFSSFSDRDRARFINSLTGFKPANLIGTINSQNQTNLCIVSSAFHLGAKPALLGFIIRPDIVPRHTLINLRESGICTLNHVNGSIFKQAHQTSARYSEHLSEFDACSLTPEFIESFRAPFVQESNIKVSLELVREQSIPENGTHLIITKIKSAYLPEKCLREDGSIDIELADSVCVSGLDNYHQTKSLGRQDYAKVDKI